MTESKIQQRYSAAHNHLELLLNNHLSWEEYSLEDMIMQLGMRLHEAQSKASDATERIEHVRRALGIKQPEPFDHGITEYVLVDRLRDSNKVFRAQIQILQRANEDLSAELRDLKRDHDRYYREHLDPRLMALILRYYFGLGERQRRGLKRIAKDFNLMESIVRKVCVPAII